MEKLKQIYQKIMSWIGTIPTDKWLHLVAGMLVAAFFAFVIPQTATWCVIFSVAAGIMKETIDQIRYKGWDWVDLAYTGAGGVLIQIIAWL